MGIESLLFFSEISLIRHIVTNIYGQNRRRFDSSSG